MSKHLYRNGAKYKEIKRFEDRYGKKKGLTLEEFKILWEERKQFNSKFG